MGRNPMVDSLADRFGSKTTIGIVTVVALLAIAGDFVNKMRLLAQADDQVAAWCNRLAADKDEKGSWKQWPSELPEKDPWGNSLRVYYERDKHTVRLTVSSDGSDGKQFTRDDRKSSVDDTDWAGVIRDGVEEVAGAASRGTVGGAIDGVTDRIRKARRDKKEGAQK